ncbi:MAG: HIT family protein [Deltaproteobacteria bacterium]|nr:HIT family protein [Deltaproteobacteria bacterium]
MPDSGDCLFCKIVAGEIPSTRAYEDRRVVAFMDINPINQGHLLVIPRNHAATIYDIEPEDLAAVYAAAQKLARAQKEALDQPGLNLIQSNGRAASQMVDHFHLHLIPRWLDDAFAQVMNWKLTPGDMDQIKATAEKIKAAL